MTARIAPETSIEIAELREQGWSTDALATKFGVSHGAVAYHCLKQGAVTPRTVGAGERHGPASLVTRSGRIMRRFLPDEDERILALSLAGRTPAEIARQTGRARSSIVVRLMTLAMHQEIADTPLPPRAPRRAARDTVYRHRLPRQIAATRAKLERLERRAAELGIEA